MSDEPIIGNAVPIVVTTTMAVKMLDHHGNQSEHAIRWEYRPADPYALWMHIVPGQSAGVVWQLSREALADAVFDGAGKGMIGDGDVRFEVTAARVRVYLYGTDGGWARLIFSRDALRVYLRSTLAVVRWGQEHKHYDLDAELAQLLTGEKEA